MQLITSDELVNYKVLPFDIYNEKGKVIFGEGEILTPGKLLQLKYIKKIFVEDEVDVTESSDIEILEEEVDSITEELTEELDKFDNIVKDDDPVKAAYIKYTEKPIISEETKNLITRKYKEVMDQFIEEGSSDPTICMDIRDQIIEKIIPEVNNILYRSQLKLKGDYYEAHGANVAMLSAVLAHKMNLPPHLVNEITLAAMLHDIGKIKIPESIVRKPALTSKENKLMNLHPRLGYSIIKNDLKLSDTIACVALQHHEKTDGSGYPYGISGDNITIASYIVSICNMYDQLTSGKAEVKVKNNKDAIKYILDLGTKSFKSDVLYTFVHMTNYNDFAPINTDYY